ncbi:MAG: hypothetical protein KGH57_01200 [Candidatus Micrarchaeota archaeon]|nr:hypothetical protein [Candidatus Micrarchaeota archaeon]
MKAQFATIEAGIAFAAVISAITFASGIVNSSTAGLAAQSASLQRGIAIYDIFNALQRNATYNDCVLQLYDGGQTGCMAGIEQNLSAIFGIGSISIGIGQNGTACSSVPLAGANSTAEVCVSFA